MFYLGWFEVVVVVLFQLLVFVAVLLCCATRAPLGTSEPVIMCRDEEDPAATRFLGDSGPSLAYLQMRAVKGQTFNYF